MIAAFSFLNATKNLWLLGIGAAFVAAVFFTGVKYDQMKDAAEIAEVNVPLAKLSGQDEAQVPANEEAGKAAASAVAGAVKQQCIITAETARLMVSLK